MSDFVLTYNVPGVPDLQVGVSDTGQVSLVIGTESATLGDPAQITAVQQVLEQAGVDQNRIYLDRFYPDRCPGSGRPWGSGTGTPICPECHLGPRGLGVQPPRRRTLPARIPHPPWTGSVPEHDRPAS